jgi:hypothetical protein
LALLAQAPKFTVPGDALVDGPGELPSLTISLDSTPPGIHAQGELSRDGTFALDGVSAGAYRVSVRGLTPPMYLRAMRYGADDVAEGIVNATADGDTLTLVLGTDSGRLSGTVQTSSGEPASNIPVTIAPPDELANRLDLLKSVRTDTAGHFQAAGLAPGEYKVYAWGDPDVPMAESAEFREEFANRATAVTIDPVGAATVQVKAIPAEEIRKAK